MRQQQVDVSQQAVHHRAQRPRVHQAQDVPANTSASFRKKKASTGTITT